jgi:iron(III) transport system permease protein
VFLCLLIGLLALTPLAYLLIRTVGEDGGGARASSFLFSLRTLEHAGTSLGLAAVVTTASTLVALLLALCTGASDLPFRRTCTVLVVCPLAIPCYVGAAVYIGTFSPGGLLDGMNQALGIRYGWFSGFWASAFVLTLFTYPLAYLPIRAGLSRSDRTLLEAARALGHSRTGSWVHGMLPQIRPSLVAGSLMVALYTLSEFGAVSMLRCNTFTRVIYLEYESAFDRTGAALSSLALVALIGLVLLLGEWMRGRNAAGHSGRPARPCRWRLGRWRWVGVPGLIVFTTLSVGIPLISILDWWGRNRSAEPVPDAILPALVTTLSLAVVAAVVVVVLALPTSMLASRHPSTISRMIERITHIGFGLPGIVIGLALVFVTLRLVPAVYQTWGIVIAGYVILFLAQASGPLRAGFDRAPRPLEDAARTLGARWPRRLRRITIPLLIPGMSSAFLLVFISTTKELPNTLLLAPAGSHTLSTRIWQYTEEAMYAESALPALMLIALSAMMVAGLVWREGMVEKTA